MPAYRPQWNRGPAPAEPQLGAATSTNLERSTELCAAGHERNGLKPQLTKDARETRPLLTIDGGAGAVTEDVGVEIRRYLELRTTNE